MNALMLRNPSFANFFDLCAISIPYGDRADARRRHAGRPPRDRWGLAVDCARRRNGVVGARARHAISRRTPRAGCATLRERLRLFVCAIGIPNWLLLARRASRRR